jgi:hypothetical protein
MLPKQTILSICNKDCEKVYLKYRVLTLIKSKAFFLIQVTPPYIQYQQTKPLIDAPFIFVYMYP